MCSIIVRVGLATDSFFSLIFLIVYHEDTISECKQQKSDNKLPLTGYDRMRIVQRTPDVFITAPPDVVNLLTADPVFWFTF